MRFIALSKMTSVLSGFVLLSNTCFAFHWFRSKQSPPPPTNLQLPRLYAPNRSTSAPFDAGLSVLIAAGVAYASKRGYDKRKKIKAAEKN